MKILKELLKRKTPYGYEDNVYEFLPEGGEFDLTGNYIIDIGAPKGIFTAHLDTVHPQNGIQEIEETGIFWTSEGVLGADDKAGVYVLIEMINADIDGRYIFTIGEESGCIGSNAIDKEVLRNMKFAIGFDRKGYHSVITHQSGRRTCSDDFALTLGETLGMAPDDTGVWTDTAVWVNYIPQCANISVGYFNAHSQDECVNAQWLEHTLLPSLMKVDWDALPLEH